MQQDYELKMISDIQIYLYSIFVWYFILNERINYEQLIFDRIFWGITKTLFTFFFIFLLKNTCSDDEFYKQVDVYYDDDKWHKLWRTILMSFTPLNYLFFKNFGSRNCNELIIQKDLWIPKTNSLFNFVYFSLILLMKMIVNIILCSNTKCC